TRTGLGADADRTSTGAPEPYQTLSREGPKAAHSRHRRCLAGVGWGIRGPVDTRPPASVGRRPGVASGASKCAERDRGSARHSLVGMAPVALRSTATDEPVRLC